MGDSESGHARKAEPGLALRMQRERRVISSQHRQLGEFLARLAAALDGGRTSEALAAFQRFADALEAHLSLEDGLYFPALRGLRPALEPELESLAGEHQTLRERLVGLARLVEAGHCDGSAHALERLAGDLADHEGREERLLASLPAPGAA